MDSHNLKENKTEGQIQINGKLFPKVYTAEQGNNFVYLQEYFEKNHDHILRQVSQEGAIFFKGFNIRSANQMSSVLTKLGLASFQYVGGAAVRNLVIGSKDRKINSAQMFTTNQAPSDQHILFHNELLQNPNYPDYLAFYCYSEANQGGSTPLANCVQIYNYIKQKHPQFLEKLQKLGVVYSRIVGKQDNPQSLIGRGWKNIYKCNTKEELTQKVAQNGYSVEWLQNQDCKLTSQTLKGIVTSKSGKKSFCNQIIAALKGWKDDKNLPQNSLRFGDGTPLPLDTFNDICEYVDSVAVKIQWKSGDFVIIDNQMVMHSRQPFKGFNRKVFASLFKGSKPIKKGLYQTLNSGDLMPLVGFGTWKLPNNVSQDIIYNCIKAGYKLIDGAGVYGNEVEVGKGIHKAINQKIITREDLFVTSKVWSTFHKPQHVKAACRRTLKDLNLQYLDLYLMHYPLAIKYVDPAVAYPTVFFDEPVGEQGKRVIMDSTPIIDTWRAMQELVREGLVRNIGVSNFNISLLRDLINSSQIKPAVNQVELHPLLTQKNLIRFCQEKGVQVTSYSTMGGASYVELSMSNKQELIVENQIVKALAKKYGKTEPQILFRWAIQQGLAIIPKTSKAQRLKQNSDISGWSLTNDEMKQIDGLNKNKRYCDPVNFLGQQKALQALTWE